MTKAKLADIPNMTKPFDPRDHLMKLSGKEYLPVAARIAWINSEFGHAFSLTTELLEANSWQEPDPKKPASSGAMRTVREAVFKATITFPSGHTVSAHGSETSSDFGDYREKAEAKSVGRALGYAGYGTLQAPEFDETATIARDEARREARGSGKAEPENTYENTRAVDAAQDLSRIAAAKAQSQPPEVAPSAPIPIPTAPTGTPSLTDMTHDQLRDEMLRLVAVAKGNQATSDQITQVMQDAKKVGNVSRVSDLPTSEFLKVVQSAASLVAGNAQPTSLLSA